jgi:phospholipase C
VHRRLLATGLVGASLAGVPVPASGKASPEGIGKIEHVIVIMQENRTFDH